MRVYRTLLGAHQPARSRRRREARRPAGREAAGRVRQHPRAVPLGVPLEGRRAARRRASDADQDHRRALPGARAAHARRRTPTNFPRSSRSQSSAACPRTWTGWPPKPAAVKQTPVSFSLLVLCCAGAARSSSSASRPTSCSSRRRRSASRRARWTSDAVEVRFAIAEGYYMYRERFRFAADGPRRSSARPSSRRASRTRTSSSARCRSTARRCASAFRCEGAGRFDLTVTSQGCADVGVCYVPMESKARSAAASLGRRGAARVAPASRFSSSDLEIARLFQGSFAAGARRASSASACCSRSRLACCR